MLQIMKILWLLFFTLALPVNAEVYRWVDDNGNVVYSDEPHADAETIDLPAPTTYTPVEASQSEADILRLSPDDEDNEDSASEVPDYQLRIISPADDESIWVNNGDVSVSMVLEPALDPERGDMIVLSLDGTEIARQATTAVQLDNLDRGTHTLSAKVIDKNGSALTDQASVIFHLHRNSIQNNQNTNASP
ncbi:DUF4124 domain-containing protein [Methylophaga sp.]|uniref:DUF4124 domain-containing protein n=1 Tax=Methylophaga sp. TaxID=2024840 RepID=UPI003F69857C